VYRPGQAFYQLSQICLVMSYFETFVCPGGFSINSRGEGSKGERGHTADEGL
jgi:hypothetical protein